MALFPENNLRKDNFLGMDHHVLDPATKILQNIMGMMFLLQVSQLLIVGPIMLCSCTFYHQKNPCVSLCCHHHKSECIFLQVSSKLPNTIGVHLAIGTTIITWTPGVLIRARNWWNIAQIKQGWWNLRRFFPSHYLAGNHGGSLWKWVLCPSPTSSVELVWESWPL